MCSPSQKTEGENNGESPRVGIMGWDALGGWGGQSLRAEGSSWLWPASREGHYGEEAVVGPGLNSV